MSTTIEPARELADKLITNEENRRRAVRRRDRQEHNRLANENRELIGAATPGVLRSLVTIWMFDLVEMGIAEPDDPEQTTRPI